MAVGDPLPRTSESSTRPPTEIRSDAERDLDRLLYTLYFRRLSGITQVASLSAAEPNHYGLVHNRLTHSLKVGQVARRMAQYLKARELSDFPEGLDPSILENLDPDIAEFSGRAHDIGHPPFGHLGDEVLLELSDKEEYALDDGFEGNAQSFRVLTTLARRRPVRRRTDDDADGDPITSLQLTDKALASTVKYPFARGDGPPEKVAAKKFGYIKPDKRHFAARVQPFLVDGNPTLEAQIMDWSDDITYATHDIEDFGANGRIPLTLLRHDKDLRPASAEEVGEFRSYAQAKLANSNNIDFNDSFNLVQRLLQDLPARIVPGSTDTASALGRMTSRIITRATNHTSLDHHGNLDRSPDWVGAIEILKLLTWYYVIDSPELVRVQRGQKKRLAAVAKELTEWALSVVNEVDNNRSRILQRRLPQHLGELVVMYVKENNGRGLYDGNINGSVVRAVIDFVASMTEQEVDQYYRDMCQ